MRLLILLASVCTLAIAKPETYREKEDFEYSRSSSDDGSKSGFYGAQRGNMGGNYEHAHNMDPLAQHQMSSLVRQVDGELGSGADTRTGSVFTSGNSRGIYGSGMYDLSNLKGRNFEESHAFGGSHSSLSSNSGSASSLGYGHEHALSNSRYSSSQSQSARESSRFHHHSSGESASDLVTGGQQAESLHSGLQNEYDHQTANNYKYYSGGNGYNSNSRYVSSVPTKIYIRPGQKVTIPITSQTYDASQFNAHLHDQNSINSDAEVLSSGSVVNTLPVSKHYESSYKYKKEWEKHDTQTFATPTENPFSQNIEHFDNVQSSQASNHHDNFDINRHSGSNLNNYNSAQSNAYSAGSRSSSYQSGYHSGSAAESQNLDSSFRGSHSKDYLHDAVGVGNLVQDTNSQPKHYSSSYSYHKAWERQGDPYVIVPDSSSGGSELQSSQKLTAASENYGHSSTHQGSQYSQYKKSYSSGCNIDCVNGHIRVARSYKTDAENLQQQSQNEWANVEDLGQQTQENWDQLGDLTQQQQTTWDQADTGKISKNLWNPSDNLNQQSQTEWDKIENLGQQNGNQNPWYRLHLGNVQHNQHYQDQFYNDHTRQDIPNQDYENWMQNLYQHNMYGKNINFRQDGFGHRNDYNWHQIHDGSISNTNSYKQFSDFWNNQYSNGEIITMKHGPHSDLSHSISETRNQDFSIHNLWNKLDQIDDTLQRQNNKDGQYSVDKKDDSTDQTLNKKINNNFNVEKNVKIDEGKNEEEVHMVHEHPIDVGRGDIGAEDLTSELISEEQNKDNGPSSTVINNDERVYHNLQQNTQKNESHDVTTTEKSVELNVLGLQNEQSIYHVNSFDKNFNVDTETANVSSHHSTTPLKIEQQTNHQTTYVSHNADKQQNTDKQLNYFNQQEKTDEHLEVFKQPNTYQQLEDYGQQQNTNQHLQPNTNQQLEDFGQQQNTDQNLEHFQQPNTDQQLEDFGQQQNTDQQLEDFQQLNTDQQLEDFGQQQNKDQQLEDYQHPNTDQQLEDFGQQQNTDQQLEDFKQPSAGQQLEDFGQQQNTDQQLEDFKQPSTGQQLEDFGQQQNTDQQLEDFKQPSTGQQLEDFGQQQNTDQQVEDFKQPITDQQLEDFGQQQNTDQHLEDFKQPSTGQELEDFGQQQNTDQQLEDFKQPSTGQQLEDFGQQQNTDQQVEDFKQPITDQQLEDFGQQQNTDQHLEDFKQPSTGQELEDFGQQQNTDQQLEDFKQPSTGQQLEDFGQQQNTNQQLEDFKQPSTGQQLEDFGQQQNTDQQLEDFKQPNNDQQIEGAKISNIDKEQEGSEQQLQDEQKVYESLDKEQQQQWPLEHSLQQQSHAYQESSGRSLELLIPPEPVIPTTEKPGFWKSVGNKFTGAKNTVAGWFKRS